ncbi:MAG TPA: hypothetical protein PKC18_21275, partial [Lacipirellulaceae bacterium]|nr:hypothetical protein [Lacipirellulaceae bacterium]
MEYQQGMRRLRVEQSYRRPAPGADRSSASAHEGRDDFELGASQWLISQDGTRLVGRNGTGADTFRFSPDRRSAPQGVPVNSDLLQAAQLGDLLYVTLAGQILALDTRKLGDDEADVVWQAYPAGRFLAASTRPSAMARVWSRRTSPSVYHLTWSERKRAPGLAAMMIGGLGPVTPYGVVLQEQRQLRLADPLTGETIWARTDIPAGCELFGDDDLVLAASVQEGQVYVIDARDGELVGRRKLPPTPWLLTSGRNVCHVIENPASKDAKKVLRIVDVVSGEELFVAKYNDTVRMTTLEPNLVAVVEAPDRAALAKVAAAALAA